MLNAFSGAVGCALRPVRGQLAQARCRSHSGKSLAKSSLFGQAARAASRSAPRPVAGLGGEGGVLAAGFAADAVVLVVGEEPGQVAQLGIGAGGDRAAAVAIGAQGRAEGKRRVAKLVESPPWSAAAYRRAASASSRSWSVVLIDTHEPLIRSSVQIACSRP